MTYLVLVAAVSAVSAEGAGNCEVRLGIKSGARVLYQGWSEQSMSVYHGQVHAPYGNDI